MHRKTIYLLLLVSSLLDFKETDAQTLKIYGTVYDFFSKHPLDAVTVRSTSGKFAVSDSIGKYSIEVNSTKDSLWFSYLTKNTQKYPVDTISNTLNFDVALYVDVAWLPAVRVKDRGYHLDSTQNRQDYAKIFSFKKPGLSITSPSPDSYVPGSVTAGLDLEELINMFRFKRTRRILALQHRLLQDEQDKYIDHRFTKRLVTQLTGLKSPSLEPFMIYSRPPYEFLTYMNDLELGLYIEQSFTIYKTVLKRKIGLTN